MQETRWDIRHEGRAWNGQEAQKRYELLPEKIEMHGGKLFWSDDERLTVLALLLENVGVDKVVCLGNPEVWRKAIEKIS